VHEDERFAPAFLADGEHRGGGYGVGVRAALAVTRGTCAR
jgi:hypothetical protein